VQPKPAPAGRTARLQHPATVVQPKPAPGGPAARPPHPATVVQPKPAPGGPAARPPHAATVAAGRTVQPPGRATTVQPLTFSGFTFFGLFQSAEEDALLARERQVQEYLDGLTAFLRDPQYGLTIAALQRRLEVIKRSSYRSQQYLALRRELNDLHDQSEAISYQISARDYRNDRIRSSRTLLEAEHAIYAGLNRLGHGVSKRQLLQSLEQLDRIQQQYIDVVDFLHSHDLEPYIPGLADARDAAAIRGMWDLLRHGDGLIRPAADASSRARAELRAIHLKLLGGPVGRTILAGLLDTRSRALPRNVTVAPLPPDPASKTKRLARTRKKRDLGPAAADIERRAIDIEARRAAARLQYGRERDWRPDVAEEIYDLSTRLHEGRQEVPPGAGRGGQSGPRAAGPRNRLENVGRRDHHQPASGLAGRRVRQRGRGRNVHPLPGLHHLRPRADPRAALPIRRRQWAR
jgi:hypothetical protein